jgi:hypothetical protein
VVKILVLKTLQVPPCRWSGFFENYSCLEDIKSFICRRQLENIPDDHQGSVDLGGQPEACAFAAPARMNP